MGLYRLFALCVFSGVLATSTAIGVDNSRPCAGVLSRIVETRYADLKKALPDCWDDGQLTFVIQDIDDGVREPTEDEVKALLALDYLLEHELMFISGNSSAPGIQTPSIQPYDQEILYSLVTRPVAIDAAAELVKFLEADGFRFSNGKWTKK